MNLEDFARLKKLIPELLSQMREDFPKCPRCRKFVLLKKIWTYYPGYPEFQYFYDDHPDLDNQVRILQNYGLVEDITDGNTKRYLIREELADYLADQPSDRPITAVGRKPRGFAPNAEDHYKVGKVVSQIGSDWSTRLDEICRQLQKAGAAFPESLRKQEGVDTWDELAEIVPAPRNSSCRERVAKYIKYRVNWVGRNQST